MSTFEQLSAAAQPNLWGHVPPVIYGHPDPIECGFVISPGPLCYPDGVPVVPVDPVAPVSAIPEPGTWALLFVGLLAVAMAKRLRGAR